MAYLLPLVFPASVALSASNNGHLILPNWGELAEEERVVNAPLWEGVNIAEGKTTPDVPAGTIPEVIGDLPPAEDVPNRPPLLLPPPFEDDGFFPGTIEPTIEEKGPIPWEHMFAYFATKPEDYLINPQYLLGETKALDTASFLSYHAGEADIDIYLLVFDGHQEVGSTNNLQQLATSWFPGKRTCVLSYYLGRPEKSRLAFSQQVIDALPGGIVPDLLADCIGDAIVAQNPDDQLERFLIRLSVRINWLQQQIDGPSFQSSTLATAEGDEAQRDALRGELGEAGNLDSVPGLARAALILGMLTIAASVGVGMGIFLMHRQRRFERNYYFPENEGASGPRLGAPHSGGNTAVIQFGSASDTARL